MRNVLLTVASLTLAAGPAAAQTFPAPAQPAAPWAQKLVLGVTSHDFGTVPHGAQLKHRFKIKNVWQVPLQITEIRSSCGCLTFTGSHYEVKDRVVMKRTPMQPEEEGYIDINMDGRRFTGPKKIELFITVGPQFVSTAIITVTANARSDVVFNPGQVEFGLVRKGQAVRQTIDVEYAGALDWRILQVVKNAQAPFTVEPQELYRKVPGVFGRNYSVGYRIAVTLKSNAPAGPFHEDLLLKTNDPNSAVLTVAVEGNVEAPLNVTPSVVALGTVKAGMAKTQRIQLRANRPFRILSVEGGGTDITAEMPSESAPSHILSLNCRPATAGEFRKQLTIQTDLDGGTTATVTVEGTVQP